MQIKHTAEKRNLKERKTGQTHEVWIIKASTAITGIVLFCYAYDAEPIEVLKNLNADTFDSEWQFKEKVAWNYMPYSRKNERLDIRRPTTAKGYWHLFNV